MNCLVLLVNSLTLPYVMVNISYLLLTHTQKIFLLKVMLIAGHQWFKPVILAAQEAEIRRIVVRSQPRQTVSETLS
jgi:hypothetical protein